MTKSKLLKAAGRFGVRYGQLVKRKIAGVEAKQRKKQQCLFCNGRAKRISKGIWLCQKCGKKFASHAYYLEEFYQQKAPFVASAKAKPLKKENTDNKQEVKLKKSKKQTQ